MDILDKLFPVQCMSYTARGKRCKHRVERRGQRCDACWESLLGAKEIATRMALTVEPNIPDSALSRLAKDPIMAVRMKIAARSNLPLNIQKILAKDHLAVQRNLIANPFVDPDIYHALAEIDDEYIRSIVIAQQKDDRDKSWLIP